VRTCLQRFELARGWLPGVMCGGLLALVGWWFSPAVGPGFSRAFATTAGMTLGALEYGAGGHARFAQPGSEPSTPSEHDRSWDMPIELSIDGVETVHRVSVNPRRLAFLPSLLFMALIVGAPLCFRDKLRGLAIGLPLLWVSALGSVWITVAWLFARVPRLVYDLSHWQSRALDLAYEGLVTSLANKFIIPVLLAVGLGVWLHALGAQSLIELSLPGSQQQVRGSPLRVSEPEERSCAARPRRRAAAARRRRR